jgi:hypothetical protein
MATNTRDSLEPDDRPRAGFPLASLALLVTSLACLLACADIHRFRAQYAIASANGMWQLAVLFGIAGVFGGIVGLVYILRRPWNWRALVTAPLMGSLAGEASVLILLGPGALWRTILSVSTMITVAILVRLGTD